MAAIENINVPRNGHARVMWQYQEDNGEPADLTGCTIAAVARNVAGGPDILATADVDITIAEEGLFTTLWDGSDFDDYGEAMGESIAAYDIKITRADSIIDVPMRGHLYIIPECTE
jgi:hypothetical protein